MEANQFFDSLDYYDALVKWVEEHPTASFNEYVKARNQLRKKFSVEFLEEWRHKK